MAITIVQQPQAVTLVGVIPDIIVETTGLGMVLNLKIGSTVLLSEYYTPDASGRSRVNLRDFIDEQLSVDIPGDVDLYEQTNSWKAFTVELIVGVETTDFSFIAIKGGSSKLTLECASFLRDAWLTWQVQTKYVRDVDPEWISYYAQYASLVKCRAYFSGGTSETITLHTLEAGKHYTINATFSDIREEFVSQPVYFDLWVENSGGTTFTTWQMRYVLTTEEFDYNDLFLFKNGLGGIDTIRFSGEKRSVNPMEVAAALFYDEYEIDYQITPKLAFEKNTGYFPSREAMLWAQDFFLNKHRYIYEEEELVPIRLISPETLTQDWVLVSYEFTYGYTRQTPYLALFKKKNPLIDPIIVGPGDEDTYLPPDISEFPQQTDPSGLLFPVQKPGTPGWFFITWENMLAEILENLPDPVIAHDDTTGIKGGVPDDYWHLTLQELLKLQNLTENVSANRRTLRGTTTYLDATTAQLENYKWVIDGTEWTLVLGTKVTDGVPADFPREDHFIGKTDGSVDYRPSVVDFFGNSTPPVVADDEVTLEIVKRNTDGSEDVVEPPVADFSNFLFETAPEENTVGKYAKIFEGTITPNANYQLHIQYAAPSADPDWPGSASGKSGLLVVNVFAHEGIAITGLQFYTVDPASQSGDWVIQRFGDTFAIYHHSTQYWMHAYFRATFTNYPELVDSLMSGQPYAALPGGSDQQLDSAPFKSGVQSASGDGIDLTDPDNPVWEFPTPAEIGAQDDLGTDVNAAILAANVPSGINPLATMADIPTPGIPHGPSDGKVRGSKDGAWAEAQPLNKDPYANQAAMLADQANQIAGFLYNDGTSTWAKLAASTAAIGDYVKVGDVATGGGGADANAVHYNAADSKTASEKQQARDNIGSSVGIPTYYTGGNVSNLARSTNFIVFTAGSANHEVTGLVSGTEGEECLFWNRRIYEVVLRNEGAGSTAANRFSLGEDFRMPSNEITILKYSSDLQRWVFRDNSKFLSKTKSDTAQGPISITSYPFNLGNPVSPIGLAGVTWKLPGSAGSKAWRIDNGVDSEIFWLGNTGVFNFLSQTQRFGSPVSPLSVGWTIKFPGSGGATKILRIDNGVDTEILGLLNGGRLNHARSGGSTESIRRDEKRLYEVITVTTVGAIHNQALTDGTFNYRFTAATSITGFANGEIGRTIDIDNASGALLTLEHENAGSIAANRIKLIGAVALILPIDGKATLKYCTGSRWELVSKNF